MLARGLRSHSVYDYGGYRLSYIKTAYKHRNIPVQMKDGCRLLIKPAVFIQHLVVKEILLHGLYNTWKTSLLYKPSTVNPLCCDAAFDSCGASSRVHHTDQHLLGKPANRTQCWLSCRPCYKRRWFSCQRSQPFEEGFSYHFGWLSVTVCALVPSKAPFSDHPMSCRTPF